MVVGGCAGENPSSCSGEGGRVLVRTYLCATGTPLEVFCGFAGYYPCSASREQGQAVVAGCLPGE